MNLLLLSTSHCAGETFLAHADEAIDEILADVTSAAFVPFALADWDGYTERYREGLKDRCEVRGAHSMDLRALERCEALVVGGGNTFRLLRALHERQLVGAIRALVADGMPYVGASAGSVVAGPTIRTTNDMPIVETPTLDGLDLVGFHLNCHYLDPERAPEGYMAEIRDHRLVEFLEENDSEVVCLREEAWLRVTDRGVTLGGPGGGKYFHRGAAPVALEAGSVGETSRRWGG